MMCMTYHDRIMKNIEKLAPRTKKAAMEWYKWCEQNHIDILIYETIRTEEQQRENVKKGVSKTMRSYHLVGQALDFVPIVNGKADWNGYNRPEIQKAIAKAKELGFTWGGDWKTFKDMPHLQYDKVGYGQDTDAQDDVKKIAPVMESKAIVPYPGKPLKLGSKGKDVKRVQQALKIKADGVFGKQTEAAVKAYQKRKGLVADGIVGPKTWNMLF